MREWYRIQAKAGEETATIDVFGDIGKSWLDDDTVTAKQFAEDLKALPESVKALQVRVNSLGGDVFDGVAIANLLREQRAKGRTVAVDILGIAASAASIVIMAGDPIRIGDNAMVVIHDPWSLAVGNAAEMRKSADMLDAVRETIVATYRWRAELGEADLRGLMADETWMSADDAILYGFATEKVEGLKAAASLDRRSMARLKVPEAVKDRVDALLAKSIPSPAKPEPAAAIDVLRLCREADCLDLAEGLVAAGAPLDQVRERVTTERQQRADAAARAADIRALCATAKLPELADGYIAGSMALEAVRAHLTTMTAKLDAAVAIDGSLSPGDGTKKPAIDLTAVYAARNRLSVAKEH